MLRLRIILLCAITCLFVACQDNNLTIGENWFNPSTQIIRVDTCSVKLSTIMIRDSIITSGTSAAFVGKYNDNYVGEITASSYIEFNLPDLSGEIDKHAEFDSLVIYLTPKGKFFGDTLQTQSISIYKMAQTLTFDDKTGYLYNTSTAEIENQPLITTSFIARPSDMKMTVEARLPDQIGEELLDKIIDKTTEFENQTNFSNYFKGIALLPGNVSTTIMNYDLTVDTSLMIKLYYHELRGDIQKKEIIFKANSAKQFNRITADRSQTMLKDLGPSNPEILSTLTGNQAFTMSGAPLYAKLEFPSIDHLRNIGQFGVIKKAILRIRPIQNTYWTNTPLPSVLNLYAYQYDAGAGELLRDEYNNVINAQPVIDNIAYENTYYEFNLTRFLNSQLGAPENYKRVLRLMIPSTEAEFGSSKQNRLTIDRLVIGNSYNDQIKNRIELIIDYSSYVGEN